MVENQGALVVIYHFYLRWDNANLSYHQMIT
jgi:hypothetical protein